MAVETRDISYKSAGHEAGLGAFCYLLASPTPYTQKKGQMIKKKRKEKRATNPCSPTYLLGEFEQAT